MIFLGACLPVNSVRPGLQVLATASHYWPLDAVDGIHELWDQIGNRPGYVNGSNISMCIRNPAAHAHGNASPKRLCLHGTRAVCHHPPSSHHHAFFFWMRRCSLLCCIWLSEDSKTSDKMQGIIIILIRTNELSSAVLSLQPCCHQIGWCKFSDQCLKLQRDQV